MSADGMRPVGVVEPVMRPITPPPCVSSSHNATGVWPPATHVVVDPMHGQRPYCEPCAAWMLAYWRTEVERRVAAGSWKLGRALESAP